MNLIEPDKVYYHNVLRIMPSPPKSRINEDGDIEYISAPSFSMEVKDVFDEEALLRYYCKTFGLNVPSSKETLKQFKSQLVHMVKKYRVIKESYEFAGLDIVLFTIDYARDVMASENQPLPYQPFDIEKYARFGIETLENKRAREKKGGIDGARSKGV